MKFPFQHYRTPPSLVDGSEELWRPEIPLHLIGSNSELFTYGLLDSGADGVLVGRNIANDIGIAVDESRRWHVRGVSGESLDVVLGHVEIELMDLHESVCWMMPVGVVSFDDPANDDIVLLGQTGFLQYFDTRLHGSKHLAELFPNDTLPISTNR